MNWQDKLQRRLKGRCIPGLSRILAGGQILVWLVVLFLDYRLYAALRLTASGLAGGQLWRAVSFLFLPTDLSVLGFLGVYLLYVMGRSMEAVWGDFRMNLYWVIGIVASLAAALLTGYTDNVYLILGLFLAYAWMYPDRELLLMMVLPVKIKYLGWAAGVLLALNFLQGDLGEKIRILFGLAAFLAFFGGKVFRSLRALIRRESWKRRNRNNWRR